MESRIGYLKVVPGAVHSTLGQSTFTWATREPHKDETVFNEPFSPARRWRREERIAPAHKKLRR